MSGFKSNPTNSLLRISRQFGINDYHWIPFTLKKGVQKFYELVILPRERVEKRDEIISIRSELSPEFVPQIVLSYKFKNMDLYGGYVVYNHISKLRYTDPGYKQTLDLLADIVKDLEKE